MMYIFTNLFSFVAIFHGVYVAVSGDNLPTCQATDFHFEYTECDSDGGRWRVSVPQPESCTGGAPNAPVRGRGCTFTCPSGNFLDIDGDQTCKPCPAGTYSMGGGERFEDWETLPSGFTVKTESFRSKMRHFFGKEDGEPEPEVNCNGSSWTPKLHHIAANPTQCTSTLVYSAKLLQAGSVTFKYQYPDDNTIFLFKVQNDECQALDDNSSPDIPKTQPGVWDDITMELKSGLNILHWQVMRFDIEDEDSAPTLGHPVLIKEIEITGVAYTSSCSKCKAGTFSVEGTDECNMCTANTYSDKGAESCTDCKPEEYSERGSRVCQSRPACSDKDYFGLQSPCDADKKTNIRYEWIEPKICREDMPNSVKLPTPTEKVDCPPCNPGQEYRNGSCNFCPANTYSDGSEPCKKCGANTAPVTGIQLKWWNNLPKNLNMTTSCLSLVENGCVTKNGWQFSTDHIHSGKGHTDDVYVVLILKLAGFKGHDFSRESHRVGNVSFVFELDCKKDCELFLMQTYPSGGTSVVKKWKGNQPKQYFSYGITRPGPVTLSWAFQKTASVEDGEPNLELSNDEAIIYSINITNTLYGGASACKLCPRGPGDDGCIPCPAGNYIDENTTRCVPCPAGSVVRTYEPWGIKSCLACGEGLTTSDDQVRCVTDCKYKNEQGQEFDFTQLRGLHTVHGSKLFTNSGTQYFHHFNVSLCANSADEHATCRDNITSDGKFLGHTSNESNSQDSSEDDIVITAPICRSTIIPPNVNEGNKILSAQPSSLADILVNITTNGTSLGMKKRLIDAGFGVEDEDIDVHFVYKSEMPTHACPFGRTTILTLRCDVQQKKAGQLELPPNCRDGTCDGCTFHLLWKAKQACPVCKEDSYTVVKGECVKGKQNITYIPPQHCILLRGREPTQREHACPRWPPLWVLITIGCVCIAGLIMCIMLIYCWSKNRNLEYKYMKLVAGAGGKDGELPAAESCAMDEGEEDEFDAVRFNESKGKRFFSRIKALGKKSENPFETIKLTDSMEKA